MIKKVGLVQPFLFSSKATFSSNITFIGEHILQPCGNPEKMNTHIVYGCGLALLKRGSTLFAFRKIYGEAPVPRASTINPKPNKKWIASIMPPQGFFGSSYVCIQIILEDKKAGGERLFGYR